MSRAERAQRARQPERLRREGVGSIVLLEGASLGPGQAQGLSPPPRKREKESSCTSAHPMRTKREPLHLAHTEGCVSARMYPWVKRTRRLAKKDGRAGGPMCRHLSHRTNRWNSS